MNAYIAEAIKKARDANRLFTIIKRSFQITAF